MDQAKKWIHCDGAYRLGLTGKGVGVAVLDTGIFPHRDFENRIVVFNDMLKRRFLPYDDNGHGTHISGIIGGKGLSSDGRYQGVAPECSLISVKVLDQKGNGFASDVLSGLKWVERHKQEYGIRLINLSVGSFSKKGMSEDSALVRGVDAAWDAGFVVVVAAGNNGPGQHTITTPGISRKVITVGCSDDYKEVDVAGSRMIDYSGRGPTSACVCKPDIVAPGSSIISCANRQNGYTVKSGTSMSTPLVSGAIALLLEKYPWMSNKDVKLHLRERAVDLGLPHNQQGWGLLDVERLVR